MATRTGTAGNDILVGTAGIDDLSGLGGDDQLTGGKAADDIDGGDGTDTARYDTAGSAVSVDLLNNRGTLGDALGDRLFNIENVVGSQFADVLQGDDEDNVLTGLGGADTLKGGGGIDRADYSASKQAITVRLSSGVGFGGFGGDAQGDSYQSIENITGSAFNDVLVGDGFDNVLSGGAGSDTLKGGGGNDVLVGDPGADILDGGSGNNTVDYRSSSTGVQVDLASGRGRFGDAEGDTIAGVENVHGSDSGDGLVGNDGSNALIGFGGNDAIFANGGNDFVSGGAGGDFMQGGSGSDTLSYEVSAAGVLVDLAGGTGSGGDAESDSSSGFERVLGSRRNDTLQGDGAADTLEGRNGDDFLVGLDGNDALVGGTGRDTLNGGDGTDSFRYLSTGDSVTGAGDVIKDFTRARRQNRPQRDRRQGGRQRQPGLRLQGRAGVHRRGPGARLLRGRPHHRAAEHRRQPRPRERDRAHRPDHPDRRRLHPLSSARPAGPRARPVRRAGARRSRSRRSR